MRIVSRCCRRLLQFLESQKMFNNFLRWAVLTAAFSAMPLSAQSYPAQPVKMIVGFPPGGTTDVIARLVAQGLAESLGKSFVVDNRGGASGSIGAGLVAKARPTATRC